jgi:hypothetical protein
MIALELASMSYFVIETHDTIQQQALQRSNPFQAKKEILPVPISCLQQEMSCTIQSPLPASLMVQDRHTLTGSYASNIHKPRLRLISKVC